MTLATLPIQSLVNRRPNESATIALDEDQIGGIRFGNVASKLSPAILLSLLERHPDSIDRPELWLGQVPVELRKAVYISKGKAWRDREGVLSTRLVAALQTNLRHDEGWRNLNLPALATRPAQRIPYAAFLRWDAMRMVIDPLLRHPDTDTRAAALSTLISATRYHREKLGEVTTILLSRRHEQDPVRLAMFVAFASLPPGRWNTDDVQNIGQLFRHALDAADNSVATGSYAESLVVALMPFHPDWAAKWLATLAKERGFLSCNRIAQLHPTNILALIPPLLPVLQSWQTRERDSQIVDAARIFGRRLKYFDALAAMLESLAKSSANAHVAESALGRLAVDRPDRLPELIPALLALDPTWATRMVVYSFLHRHRQDLLAPCLGRSAYVGRFSTGKTRFFLPVNSDFHRWTPTQQATLALTLDEVASDAKRDVPAVLAVIYQFAALPDVPPTRLIALADLDNLKTAVRDAALRALGTLDAGQGVATLLHALNDSRARISIYALRRAIMDFPGPQAVQILHNTPRVQVTVAKEVVRLLGEVATDEAFNELISLEQTELHRDVRAALLRAFWSYLDRPRTWQILDKAVASGDPGQADVAVRIPTDNLDPPGQTQLVQLLAKLLGHADVIVRVATLNRLNNLPLNDPDHLLLTPIISALASRLPDESRAAASAVFATYAGREARLVGTAATDLLSNRRALQTLTEALCAATARWGKHLLETAQSVLNALAADPLTITLRTRLAILALPRADLIAFLEELASGSQLHSDAIAIVSNSIVWRIKSEKPESWEQLEEKLGGSPHTEIRRLGLATLVAASESVVGWTDKQLARLEAYRADPSNLVAEAAQFTFPMGIEQGA
jgi:hypothetical protein